MKRASFNRLVVYSLLFIIFLVYGFYEQKSYSFQLLFVDTFAVTSAIYLSTYWGLRLVRFRLKEESNIYKHIEKIYVPRKEIFLHLIAILISIIIISFNTSNTNSTSNDMAQEKNVDKALLIKIEKECGRTDIKSIIEIDGKYIITFTDKSVKILPIKN